MKTAASALMPILFIAVIALGGCSLREATAWEGSPEQVEGQRAEGSRGAGGETAAPVVAVADKVDASKVVLFAPLGLGPLAAENPDARVAWASALALRVKLLSREATGRHSGVLPESDSAVWAKGRVAATAGAYLTVLTTITDLTVRDGAPAIRGGRVKLAVATVHMRGIDGDGNLVFDRIAQGEAEMATSPKFGAVDSRPTSVAAWEAASRAVGALIAFLDERTAASVATAPIDPATLLEVTFASEPVGADVIIDGLFRGNTPVVLRLPPKVVRVRIELAGHQPWDKPLQPSAGMTVRPVLAANATPAK